MNIEELLAEREARAQWIKKLDEKGPDPVNQLLTGLGTAGVVALGLPALGTLIGGLGGGIAEGVGAAVTAAGQNPMNWWVAGKSAADTGQIGNAVANVGLNAVSDYGKQAAALKMKEIMLPQEVKLEQKKKELEAGVSAGLTKDQVAKIVRDGGQIRMELPKSKTEQIGYTKQKTYAGDRWIKVAPEVVARTTDPTTNDIVEILSNGKTRRINVPKGAPATDEYGLTQAQRQALVKQAQGFANARVKTITDPVVKQQAFDSFANWFIDQRLGLAERAPEEETKFFGLMGTGKMVYEPRSIGYTGMVNRTTPATPTKKSFKGIELE